MIFQETYGFDNQFMELSNEYPNSQGTFLFTFLIFHKKIHDVYLIIKYIEDPGYQPNIPWKVKPEPNEWDPNGYYVWSDPQQPYNPDENYDPYPYYTNEELDFGNEYMQNETHLKIRDTFGITHDFQGVYVFIKIIFIRGLWESPRDTNSR